MPFAVIVQTKNVEAGKCPSAGTVCSPFNPNQGGNVIVVVSLGLLLEPVFAVTILHRWSWPLTPMKKTTWRWLWKLPLKNDMSQKLKTNHACYHASTTLNKTTFVSNWSSKEWLEICRWSYIKGQILFYK